MLCNKFVVVIRRFLIVVRQSGKVIRMNRLTHTDEWTKTSDEFTSLYVSLRAFIHFEAGHFSIGTLASF